MSEIRDTIENIRIDTPTKVGNAIESTEAVTLEQTKNLIKNEYINKWK